MGIVDKCIRCGGMTDNDTGLPFDIENLDENVHYNHWICGKCRYPTIEQRIERLEKLHHIRY